MDTLTAFIFDLLNATPLVGVLLILTCADVASGTMVAIVDRKFNSTTSLKGMTRKAYMIMLVGVAGVIEPHADGIPLTKLVAGCFCATELVSLLENAVALGVPVPRALRDVLEKFQDKADVELQIPEQKIVARQHRNRPSDVIEKTPTLSQDPTTDNR